MGNIGRIYEAQGDWSRALYMLTKAMLTHRELGARRHEAIDVRRIAVVLSQQGSRQEALSVLFSAAEMLKSVGAGEELLKTQRLIDEMSDDDDKIH